MLSTNFALSEFTNIERSKLPIDVLNNLVIVASRLELIRKYTGSRALYISSGYRDKDHNKLVGGAINSKHIYGKAVDIYSGHLKSIDLYICIMQMVSSKILVAGGVGLYISHVHFDIRSSLVLWSRL